jgi:hypothetical protein
MQASEGGSTVESARALKAVRFHYAPTQQTVELLETFRMVVNHAIHICLDENIRGGLKLGNRIYKEFRDRCGVMSGYPYSVDEVAWSVIKKQTAAPILRAEAPKLGR